MIPARPLAVGLALAAGCSNTAQGTFVGNPTSSMTARLADNAEQTAAGGELVVLELHFIGTDDSVTALGPTTFTFDGPDAEESIRVPTGGYQGLFLVVDGFEVRFTQDGALTTLVADDFDLTLPATFTTFLDQAYTLRLGDDAWLASLAALTEPGVVQVGSDPDLESAFFDGLIDGSTVLMAE